MPTELATAYVSIVAETSQIPRQVGQAFGAAGRGAEQEGKKAGDRYAAGVGRGVKNIAAVAGAAGGVAALGGAMKSVLSTGMDFTNSLNTMRAVSGASAQQLAAVSAEARRLGTDNSLAATSSVDAAQAMLELSKGGFSVEQSMQAARGTLQLAAAAQIEAAEAAVIQSSALQAFGKDASYAGKAADILANAANQSSAEITDVAYGLQAGGAVANQFGMSMSDTAATLALLANNGIKGSDAGTLLKSSLMALTSTSEKQNTAAEQLGLTLGANGVQFTSMSDLFGRLGAAQKRMTREQYNNAAAVLFGSDAMRLAGIAGNVGAEGFDKMAAAMGKGGAAADVASAKMAGLPGAWEQLKNSAQDAALATYDAIEGPLAKGAKLGADAIEGLTSQAKSAAPVVKEMFGQFSFAAPAVSGLTGVITQHKDVILGLAVAYGGLKVARTMSDSLTAGFSNVRAGADAAEGATGRFTRSMQGLGGGAGSLANAAGGMRNFTAAFSDSVRWMKQANPEMSNTAARFQVLRANGMNASGGMSLLKGAAGGLMGVMGGPLGIALAAGGFALGAYAKNQADAAQKAAEHKQRVDELSQSINFNTGALDAQGRAKVANELTDKGAFKDARASGANVSNAQIQQAAEGQQAATQAVNAALDAVTIKSVEASAEWKTWRGELEAAGVSLQDYNAALRGNETQQARVNKALGDADMPYDSLAKRLDEQAQAAIRAGKAIGVSTDQVGQAKDKAREMALALGLVGQNLGDLAAKFNGQGRGFSVALDPQAIAGTEDVLRRIGFQIQSLPSGQVKVTANTDEATQKLQWVTQNVSVLDAIKANPKIDLDKAMFDAKNGEARAALQGLDVTAVSPEAGLVIDKLLQGKQVSMQELQTLDQTTSNPKVDMMIDKIMQKVGIVNKGLDDAARERNATITIRTRGEQIAYGQRVIEAFRAQNNANGSIRQYLNGGIAAAEAYANGGTRLPDRALIQKPDPRGGLVQWAEPETGGEAFIPLAMGKRGRSTDILSTVASMFGYALVPNEKNVSGLAGGVAGSVVKRLLQGAGSDRFSKFADGGFRGARVTADAFRKLAEGSGASRPLEGAPYVWGGTNWGDCCLTSDNSVWTPDGAVPMDKIKPGDRVWSYVDGKLEAHEVTAAWFSKTQDVFKVRTRHRSVTGSANHPFLRLVQTGSAKPRKGVRGWEPAEYGVEWARLDELNPGDLLVQPKAPRLEFRSNTLPSGREIGLNEAWLLGLILGDGNVSDTKVEICVYGDLRDRARGVLGRWALAKNTTRAARDGIGTSVSDAHGIRAYSKEFARELTEAGFRKPAHEKRIPDCVWGWDAERQRAFLNGYCDADGHHPENVVHYGERTYASSSRELIEDVRYLHIALGDVVANVSTKRRAKSITINGKRVKNARPLHSISVRPHGEELVGSVAARRRPGVAMWHDTTDFTIAPVLSITPVGEQATYDIEVEGAHNFIAGGIVVHNSGAMSAFARLAAGLDPFGGRFATGSMAEAIKSMGGILGRGPSGSMRFGWLNGGPAGGHTAGTLPDGTNVEMGGGRGNGQLGGGAAGADDPQFTDHAYFPVEPAAPDWKDPGADSGGWVQRPDGTWVQTGPGGDYSSSGGSMSGGGGEDKSLSGRLGNVAKSFVSGQVASLFEVLSINDQPGWLAAISEYESQQQQKNSGKGPKLSKAERERLAAEYKGDKQKLKEDYDTEKLKRKQEYEAAKQKLENDYTLKKINKGDYERKLNDLKQKHDSDELKRKQEYDEKVAQAKAKYDSARGKKPEGADGKSGYESGALQSKQQYEDDKLALKQRHDNDKAARKAQYEREKKSLAAQRKSKSITKEQYEARSNELKAKYDRDIAQMKTRYDDADLKRQQEYDRQKLSGQQSFTRQSAPSGVRDPGTRRPGAGQDLGSTGNPVKDAFRAGLRDGWRMGQPWTDTDFIINKESSWNPQARNGKYFGLIQAGPEVYQAAGKSPTTTNPTEQGQVYDRYVDERYQTPMAARKHHDAKNWYDSGGAAIGTGLMAKNVLEPERVLSPKQTAAFEQMVKRDFQSGGDARMIGLLEQMLTALRENPRSNITYNATDEATLRRAQKYERSRQRAQLAGK